YLGGGPDATGHGGSSIGHAITVDGSGNACVTGETQSPHFPNVNAFQPAPGAIFVTKFRAGGGALVYSTYLSGGFDKSNGIAADPGGSAYVTGFTANAAFPTK